MSYWYYKNGVFDEAACHADLEIIWKAGNDIRNQQSKEYKDAFRRYFFVPPPKPLTFKEICVKWYYTNICPPNFTFRQRIWYWLYHIALRFDCVDYIYALKERYDAITEYFA